MSESEDKSENTDDSKTPPTSQDTTKTSDKEKKGDQWGPGLIKAQEEAAEMMGLI